MTDVVLPPPTHCPRWEGTAVQDFLRVVRRPRYGISVPGAFRLVSQREIITNLTRHFNKILFEYVLDVRSPGGTLHEVYLGWSRPRHAWVLWSHCDNGRGKWLEGSPFFALVLDRRHSPSVRKAAVNFAQKIILEDARSLLDS